METKHAYGTNFTPDSKHTPGPWEHGKNHVKTGCVAIRQHTGDAVAYATCERQGYGDPQNDAEALANARLIAAAPELLAALREWDEPGACGCDTAWCRATCLPARTRAAIAKATGE